MMGPQKEGKQQRAKVWAKAEKGLCEPEWQWTRGELRANEALT